MQQNYDLKKGLTIRHITMISIGGVIGAGLFVGSGAVIHSAGPAAIVSYILASLMVVLVMRMLGEMASMNVASGSFSTYAHEAIGPWAGFSIGWLYWFFWVIVIAIEAIAGAGILQYWFPDVPIWMLSLTLTILLTLTNVYSVKLFAEFEYWLALVKVVTIILFLGLGVAILFGLIPGVKSPGMSNLTGAGGFMPNGISSVLMGVVITFFSFVGTEIAAIAAGESAQPQKAISIALNSVVWRLLVFYIGSIAVVVSLLPWNSAMLLKSPFVSVFEMVGIPAASQIMNFIVLTAVLSCLNSGLYTSSRMLYAMAQKGNAPKAFAKVSRNGVPVRAVLAGTFFAYVSVIFNFVSPDKVFLFLVNASGGIALFVYLAIAFSHLIMRKKAERENPQALKVKMWCFPYLTYLTMMGIVSVLIGMFFDQSMRSQFYLTTFISIFVVVSYFIRRRKIRVNSKGEAYNNI
ncbi:amino acid permease [Brevibacillus fluminis]|uniref:Amino acid permease n=1 Tax=Brevibacillus fluminis TaxID=511487 RepID=A0A3M8DHT2_9BACL|nr:amino acid permease [Brevibacillus fluminis]RNB87653.1 amino acid permease [Brevibacillus fluminis]